MAVNIKVENREAQLHRKIRHFCGEVVNAEFRIDRVLFLDSKKLPRIRRRLHIPFPMSKWCHFCEKSFTGAPSLAISHHAGKPSW